MSEMTPALLDLMEHEKVIEQGLTTFVEVGWALLHIRDERKYRAAGYSSFEAYCRDRWGFAKDYAHKTIAAAEVARSLEVNTTVFTLPQSERQVRPLAKLRDQPDEAAEAWAEAVDEAGGEQPTARQVEAAVARRLPPKKNHPAPFSDDILEVTAEHVRGATRVLDPFAGTGRVHELRQRADVIETIGVEIEPEWADKHPDTRLGDALDLAGTAGIEPESVDAIVTSPTYGNRMADHHDAADDSVRLTYKHTLGRDLDDNNSGQLQWGEEYREFHRRAWAQAVAALKPGGIFDLNVKNHVRGGEEQRVVEWHITTLIGEYGLLLERLDVVPTRGLMSGANADRRVQYEVVLKFRKPTGEV